MGKLKYDVAIEKYAALSDTLLAIKKRL